MICRCSLIAVVAVALSLSLHGVAVAQGSGEAPVKSLPFLSPIFGDNMVLQRGKPNIVWGWSEPGDHVRIEIAGKRAEGVAGIDRRWQVKIPPPTAGGPYTLTIKGHKPLNFTTSLSATFGYAAANPTCRSAFALQKMGRRK